MADIGWLRDDGAPVWRWLVCRFIIPTMFFISWQVTPWFPLFLYLPHRLYLFLGKAGGVCWAKPRKQLNWSMKSWSPSKGIRVMRAYSGGTSRSNSFRRKQPVYPKQGTKLHLSVFFWTFSPVVWLDYKQSCSCYLEAGPSQAGSWVLGNYWLYSCIWSFNWAYVDDGRLNLGLPDGANVLKKLKSDWWNWIWARWFSLPRLIWCSLGLFFQLSLNCWAKRACRHWLDY